MKFTGPGRCTTRRKTEHEYRTVTLEAYCDCCSSPINKCMGHSRSGATELTLGSFPATEFCLLPAMQKKKNPSIGFHYTPLQVILIGIIVKILSSVIRNCEEY